MWWVSPTSALSIPDGYLIALLGAGLPIVGGMACAIGAWVFKSLASGDRRLTKLETWREGIDEDIRDLKGRP